MTFEERTTYAMQTQMMMIENGGFQGVLVQDVVEDLRRADANQTLLAAGWTWGPHGLVPPDEEN